MSFMLMSYSVYSVWTHIIDNWWMKYRILSSQFGWVPSICRCSCVLGQIIPIQTKCHAWTWLGYLRVCLSRFLKLWSKCTPVVVCSLRLQTDAQRRENKTTPLIITWHYLISQSNDIQNYICNSTDESIWYPAFKVKKKLKKIKVA